jgi:hypothetical protein
MNSNGIHRRLEALETRSPAPPRSGASDARRRMVAHLDRLAALRRGGATVENNAELAAISAALERRRREIRGEGER